MCVFFLPLPLTILGQRVQLTIQLKIKIKSEELYNIGHGREHEIQQLRGFFFWICYISIIPDIIFLRAIFLGWEGWGGGLL